MGMRINCEFANVRAVPGGIRIHCAAEKHGGTPTLVQCKKCKHFQHTTRGLGDKVERFTRRTGIKSLVEKVSRKTGKPCGCEKRRRLLNETFPSRYGGSFSGERENEKATREMGRGEN